MFGIGVYLSLMDAMDKQLEARKRASTLKSREQMEREIAQADAEHKETMSRLRAQWAEEDRIYNRNMFLRKLGPKGQRMNDRMQRRRDQIHKRNWTIVGIVVFWCCAPPVAIAVIALVWRVCAYLVVL